VIIENTWIKQADLIENTQILRNAIEIAFSYSGKQNHQSLPRAYTLEVWTMPNPRILGEGRPEVNVPSPVLIPLRMVRGHLLTRMATVLHEALRYVVARHTNHRQQIRNEDVDIAGKSIG
jgi:hypothetical protein